MRATVLLALAAAWTCLEARVNSIRTVLLRETHVLPGNTTRREDLHMLYQCISDLECSEGSYCHAPSKSHAYSRCQTCRRRKRRCHRDGMCCPGNRCSNSICLPNLDSFLSQRIPEVVDGGMSPSPTKKGWRKRGRTTSKLPSVKGQVGDPCLRSSDCSEGLCCARHFWARICKPVLLEGQVCTRHRRKAHHGLELFQRCDCGEGLTCRTLREPNSQSPSSSSSFSSSSSQLSSSSLLAADAKSKLSPLSSSSRHSSPHTSLLSSSSSSSSSSSLPAAKTRLHVCQRN